jgi:NodT family efflux transporter outer membrane factor (OMF) lipoprotein
MMSINARRTCTALSILAPALLVAGCTLGPDFRGAPPVAADAFQAATFKRAPQEGVSPTAPVAATWWESLGDPQLNQLIATALSSSPDLRAAEARLRQSRAGLRQQRGDQLPKIGGTAAYLHAQLPDSPLGTSKVDFYNLGFDATWEADLFGGTRRAVEAASAEARATEADVADAHVQLAAEIAQAYVQLRDGQQRLELVRKSVDVEDRALSLTQQRRTQGVASDLDVERIRTQVENTRAALIPLDEQIAEALDELAVLTGREPGALDAELTATAPLPKLPEVTPVGDPASLLRRRPDIRAAELRLASKNAQIGERIADYFPKLTLIGDLGFSAAQPGELVRSENFMWIGAPLLQWNAFDFGRTKARVEQAHAGFDEASAKYESTVLSALHDANVALSRYGHQRQSVVRLRSVEASATRSAELTEQRYRAGTTSALEWLDAERTRFSAEQNRISADADLLKDYVSLQKSLGLGWQQL